MEPVQDSGSLNLEYREADRTISGHFPYNKYCMYSASGPVRRERFASHAFRSGIENRSQEVHLLVAHDWNRPLACRSAGSLTLSDGPQGVNFRAVLPPNSQQTTWQKDAVIAIKTGLTKGLSPGFAVEQRNGGEQIVQDPGYPQYQCREVRGALMREMSILGRPAYGETELDIRGFFPDRKNLGSDTKIGLATLAVLAGGYGAIKLMEASGEALISGLDKLARTDTNQPPGDRRLDELYLPNLPVELRAEGFGKAKVAAGLVGASLLGTLLAEGLLIGGKEGYDLVEDDEGMEKRALASNVHQAIRGNLTVQQLAAAMLAAAFGGGVGAGFILDDDTEERAVGAAVDKVRRQFTKKEWIEGGIGAGIGAGVVGGVALTGDDDEDEKRGLQDSLFKFLGITDADLDPNMSEDSARRFSRGVDRKRVYAALAGGLGAGALTGLGLGELLEEDLSEADLIKALEGRKGLTRLEQEAMLWL